VKAQQESVESDKGQSESEAAEEEDVPEDEDKEEIPERAKVGLAIEMEDYVLAFMSHDLVFEVRLAIGYYLVEYAAEYSLAYLVRREGRPAEYVRWGVQRLRCLSGEGCCLH
jgi:hypothetical protein